MNSRDRVIATLEHKQADRVPIGEMWIDPKVVSSILPAGANANANDLVEHLDTGG